jgi:hypothetical protein
MGTWYNFEEIGLPAGHAYPEVQFLTTRLMNFLPDITIGKGFIDIVSKLG